MCKKKIKIFFPSWNQIKLYEQYHNAAVAGIDDISKEKKTNLQ